MRKVILIIGLLLIFPSMIFADGNYIGPLTLSDDTLITDTTPGQIAKEMKACMIFANTQKELILTGAATDTFAIYKNGALIQTVILATTKESWTSTDGMFSLKVDMTAVAGSPATTMNCYWEKEIK